MIRRAGRGRRLGALLLAAAALAACGKKGPPVTPESRLPLPAAALAGRIEEEAIVLSWANPRTRADGSALRELATVRLYRREDAVGAPLRPALLVSGRIPGYQEVAVLPAGGPAGPAAAQWIDRQGLVPGRRYAYVLTTTDAAGRTSAPSERLVVPFRAGPEPPRAVEATAGDREVALRWAPPPGAGEGPLAYVVLRGADAEGALVPLTPAPIAATSYVDRELDNDRTYRYAVRAVREEGRVPALGAPSAAVAAVPRDTTAPRPPTALVAVPTPGAVRLAWTASPDEDVALYAVYRAAGGGAFLRIGTALATATTFIDREVRPGVTYRYAVTALDRAQRPNESARSNEATAEAR